MARRKITASEMAKIFHEWDTDDDISEEDDETIPVTANVQSDSSQNESDVSDFDLSETPQAEPLLSESMKAVGRDGTSVAIRACLHARACFSEFERVSVFFIIFDPFARVFRP